MVTWIILVIISCECDDVLSYDTITMVQFFLLYKNNHFPTKSTELSTTQEKEHPCIVIVAEKILNRHERTRNIGDSEIVVPVQLQDRQRDDRHDDHWLHHHGLHLLVQRRQQGVQQFGYVQLVRQLDQCREKIQDHDIREEAAGS